VTPASTRRALAAIPAIVAHLIESWVFAFMMVLLFALAKSGVAQVTFLRL
jgi:hypothetical protein